MKKRIKIYQSSHPFNPRKEMDNLGTMICFHRRYNLGDETDLKTEQFESWKELSDHLIKYRGAYIILPLYLYDHSGITMSTGPFNCPWDSGQVGFIYITRDKILSEYGGKRINKGLKDKVTKCLIGEVETYDQYLTGDVFDYEIEVASEMVKLTREDFNAGKFENVDDEIEWNQEDSCGGFFGYGIDNGITEYADAPKEIIQEALDNLENWVYYE